MNISYITQLMRKWTSLVLLLLLITVTARSQNPFEDAVKQLTSDNAKGYLQPFITSVGANLNSGTYQTADIGTGSFHLKIQIIGMGTLIGDAEKVYSAVPPQPFDQTPVQTATVFGGTGTTVYDPTGTVSYQFQNGQVKASIVPFAVPQVTVGDFFGTQATIRYIPIPEVDKFPKTTLFGIGARHSISRYLPTLPVDLSAGLFYQTLTVGDLISAKTFNLGAQVSKTFSIATLYGGLQFESSSMDLNYTYTGPNAPVGGGKVSLSMDGANKFRATAGLSLNLFILHLNADINVGKVTVVSGGLGFGI